jgi:homoserine O-acetyltransferase
MGDRFSGVPMAAPSKENRMTFQTPTATPSASAARPHVEACRSTGTSPGRAGHVRVRLDLDSGASVDALVGYELHGRPGDEPIVVLGGISADRHLAPTRERAERGWWPGVVGPGEALDTDRTALLGIDYLVPERLETGRAGGVAEAGEVAQGTAWVPPRVTSSDQARALAAVLDALDFSAVTLVGASYGGMVGLAFARLFPSRARRLLILCAAHRTHPMATALRAVQRRIVRLACEAGRPADGLSLGRALAMTTYRSAEEFDRRFDWRPEEGGGAVRFPVERYLDARGDDFAARFSAERFTRLSESIDLHRVDPDGLTVPTVLVSVDTDALVPSWLVDELTERAPGVELHLTLRSIYGHDAFLKETALVSDVIRSCLITGVAA